jgi:hypothetical protein
MLGVSEACIICSLIVWGHLMELIKVGIVPQGFVMGASRWTDECGIEWLEIIANQASEMFLGKFSPKTTAQFYTVDGSIGSYTLVAKIPELFIFGRGDLSKAFAV